MGERSWLVVPLLFAPRPLWLLPGLPVLAWGARRRSLPLLAAGLLGLVVWALPLSGFVLPGLPVRAQGPTLRVLSYNTGHGVDGPEALRALVQRTRADLVLFQWTSQVVTDALTGPGFEGWTSRRMGQYTVASRFPVGELEGLGPADGYGYPAARGVVATPWGPVEVINLRPKSARTELAAKRHLGLRGRVHTFLDDLTAGRVSGELAHREADLHVIAEAIAHARHPLLVAGDTNLPQGSLLFERTFAGLTDAFVESSWGFGWTHPAKLPWLRLDRVLLGSGLRAVSFDVLPRLTAGHRAVLAEIARDP